MLISLSLSICQFQYFVGLFTFVTSLLLLTKMAAPYTIMQANESPMTKRPTAARKIASVQAGITFIGSGKGVAFLGICFPRQQTEFPKVKGRNLGHNGVLNSTVFSSTECLHVF